MATGIFTDPATEDIRYDSDGSALDTATRDGLTPAGVIRESAAILRVPIVPRFALSGLYETRGLVTPLPGPHGVLVPDAPTAAPAPVNNRAILRETLRLDVDGRYPQMAASGTIYEFLTERTHWVARLTRQSDGSYAGAIWYRNGDISNFPFTNVTIVATGSPFPNQRQAVVRFSASGSATRVQRFNFISQFFHPSEFEYDTVQGSQAETSIETRAHPNCPSGLPAETLSIESVYRRAGFNVTTTPPGGAIPLANAGTNGTWSDAEMHDAMQSFWSRFADRPQWSVWTLFAALHDTGQSLGGVMFDDIGPNHRQGTAIFNESFIKTPPSGDVNSAAWIKRMKFWTAVHEMGHTFNLAHSWQKVHPASWGSSWTPLTNEPEARSFMNYPYNVAGGQSAFFANFEYRFSDQELLFMRHAPERFVQQGNANWFDNHGFEQTRRSSDPAFKLELRVNRDKPLFEFLEPVVIELKLTNVSTEPQLIEEQVLATADRMTVALKREGRGARQYSPFAQNCWRTGKTVLQPGESRYESLFVAVGKNGWDVAEPGRYIIQTALHLENEDVISTPLMLRIAPPRGYDEELFAQDFFTEDVGRVLAFDGSRTLRSAIDTLREGTEKFANRSVALHAHIALGMPLTKPFKELRVDTGARATQPTMAFEVLDAKPVEAEGELTKALNAQSTKAAVSLGHIDYAGYCSYFTEYLAREGDSARASQVRDTLVKTLENRNVKKEIVEPIKARLDAAISGDDATTAAAKLGERPTTRGMRAAVVADRPEPASRARAADSARGKNLETKKSGKGAR